MKTTDIYVYGGEFELKLEGQGAMLLDYHIQESHTKHVVNKGADALIGIYIEKGYVKYKSLFGRSWETKNVSGTILWVKEYVLVDNHVSCKKINTDIPFHSWEFNHFSVELTKDVSIHKLEFDEKLLIASFNMGFTDALVNKQMQKLPGAFMAAYVLGYNACNRTDGAPVDAEQLLESKSLPKSSYDKFMK